MFQHPITFVVGAGCSREYNLPVGDGLRDRIVDLLEGVKRYVDADGGRNGPPNWDPVFCHAIGVLGQNRLDPWFQAAEAMARGVRFAQSIDRFLDQHRDKEMFVTLGKLAIVRAINVAEHGSTLVAGERGLDLQKIKQGADIDWLFQLFLRLQGDQLLRNVSIVCFNYDRCIEHYLFNAIRDYGNHDDAATAAIMEALNIIHPYGTIGRLVWQEPKDEEEAATAPIRYGQLVTDPNVLIAASKRISIFTETLEETDELAAMREWVRSANRLVFLGFSFLEQNVQLLVSPRPAAIGEIWATTFEESAANAALYKLAMRRIITGNGAVQPPIYGDIITMEGCKAGHFMRQFGNALAR